MKHHLFVHQSSWEECTSLKAAYKDVLPVLKETGSSLFFCDAIGFDILAPSWDAAVKVQKVFGWKTLYQVEPGRFSTKDDVW